MNRHAPARRALRRREIFALPALIALLTTAGLLLALLGDGPADGLAWLCLLAPLPITWLAARHASTDGVSTDGVYTSVVRLDALPARASATVRRVTAPAGAPELADRLAELGFLPGERVRVIARGMPGGEPLAVRVGDSTFALRRVEAACVEIDGTAPLSGETRHA